MLQILGDRVSGIVTYDSHMTPDGTPNLIIGKKQYYYHKYYRLINAIIRLLRKPKTSAIRKHIKTNNIDTLFINYANFAIDTYHIWCDLDVKVFVHIHGFDYQTDAHHYERPDTPFWASRYEEKLIALAEKVTFIANSNYSRQRLINLGVPENRIQTKYFGIQKQPTSVRITRDERTVSEVNILFVGRLIECKGVIELIEHFISVRENIKAKLWIVGDGPLLAEAEALSDASAFRDDIVFHGSLDFDSIKTLYQEADIYASCHCVGPITKRVEAFGLSILEAMSYGLPVLTYDIGGPAEIINSDSGILVAPGDRSAYQKQLSNLCQNKSLRMTLGESAMVRAQQHFSLNAEQDRLLGIIYS